MKIIIGTTNPGKFMDIKKGLVDVLGDLVLFTDPKKEGIEEKIEEKGSSFLQIAKQKARFYARHTGLPAVSDDGGLIIPRLGGQPGVLSRRWPGYEADDEELIEYTLQKLKGFKKEERKAYLSTVVCFYHPRKDCYIYEKAEISGFIAESPAKKREAGYPFRSLFVVEQFGKLYCDLTQEEHKQVNHRLKAVRQLAKKIMKVVKN